MSCPRSLTSLKSVAYRALMSVGGGGGRNCVLVNIANGLTLGKNVNVAKLFAGGVGCHNPGKVGSTYVGSGAVAAAWVAGQPSFCRQLRTAAAAA